MKARLKKKNSEMELVIAYLFRLKIIASNQSGLGFRLRRDNYS